jgi:hypothetical protein
MQAILCRYFGPSNVRGSRIKATCEAGSVTIPYPHELSGQAVYRAAAEALVTRLGWDKDGSGALLGGCLPGGDYAFVFDNPLSKE